MKSISPKVMFITGGAKRIGAYTANFFHQKGYNIALHYRHSEQQALALAASLNNKRPNSALLLQADFAEQDTNYDALVLEIKNTWNRLDLLFNNASSFYPTELGNIAESDWQELINSNLKAPMFLAQASAELLRQSNGSIINMLDINIQKPMQDYAVYSAAKAGLANLTGVLAKELAPQIRVNGISPGNILWPEQEQASDSAELDVQKQKRIKEIPLMRQGSPQDIAQTAYFLAEQAPYITGQNICVDGGKSLI